MMAGCFRIFLVRSVYYLIFGRRIRSVRLHPLLVDAPRSVLGLGRAKNPLAAAGTLRFRRDGAWSFWAFGAAVIRVSAVRQIVQRHFGGKPRGIRLTPTSRFIRDKLFPKGK